VALSRINNAGRINLKLCAERGNFWRSLQEDRVNVEREAVVDFE
jgi:hypothetical protein